MKQTIKRTIITGAALGLLASPAAVFAHDGVSGGGNDGTTVHAESESPKPTPTTSASTDRRGKLEDQIRTQLVKQQEQTEDRQAKVAGLRDKLDDAKRKACENHVATINKLESVIDKRRTNVVDNISRIAAAVEAFYVKKNLTVANYDELVAKVDAAKAVAQQAVQQQQQIPTLDCSGDHPRADVLDFKDKRQLSVAAAKAYRDAVKELVKAVKTAVGEAKAASPSPSPKAEGDNA